MTPREKEVFDYIVAYIAAHGFAPTYAEIAATSGSVRSKGGACRIVESLEAQGYIKRTLSRAGVGGRARGIQLIDAPGQWIRVGAAAMRVLESIRRENIDGCGEGTVEVSAAAIGDLDIALAEAGVTNTCPGTNAN